MTGSQVIDAEEDRHKLVVEYKDALQPADFYHNFKQRGIRSVQLIPYLEFDDRGDLTAASVTAELWGKFLIALFECWVRADIRFADVRSKMHDALLDYMDKIRDPFRSYQWSLRPWRKDARPRWMGAFRPRPQDGYSPVVRDYDTGLPTQGVKVEEKKQKF